MSSDSTSSPTPAMPPPTDAGTEPRLGIIHIMIWTACIALAFAITRSLGVWQQIGEQWDASETLLQIGSAAFVCGHCVFFATALGGVLLWVARRRRRFAFPRHPGEWLLAAFSVSLMLTQTTWIAMLALDPLVVQSGSDFGPGIWIVLYLGFMLFQAAASTGLFAFAAVRTQVARWRVFFIIAAVIQLSQILSCIYYFALLISSGALIVALIKDRKQRARYPWPHWLGVAFYLSYGLLHVVAVGVSGLVVWLL